MMETLALMLVAIIGVPAAAVAHELTHVAVLWPVADTITCHPRAQYVEADIPDDRPGATTIARAAGLGPLVVGVLVVVASAHAGVLWPAPWASPTGLMLWGVWTVYAALGGLSDYLPAVSRRRATPADD